MDNFLIARGATTCGDNDVAETWRTKGGSAATCKAIERADKQRVIRVGENT